MSHRSVGGHEVPTSEAGTARSAQADRQEEAAKQQSSHGGGGGTCFPPNARVLTPSGWRRIADIEAGDEVLAHAADGQLRPQAVVRRRDHEPAALVAVLGRNGDEILRATPEHTVLTNGGWTTIGELREGEHLPCVSSAGSESVHIVAGVVATDTVMPVHNLIVAGDYTFVVKGCIFHSFTYFRSLRVLLGRLGRSAASVLRSLGTEGRQPAKQPQ